MYMDRMDRMGLIVDSDAQMCVNELSSNGEWSVTYFLSHQESAALARIMKRMIPTQYDCFQCQAKQLLQHFITRHDVKATYYVGEPDAVTASHQIDPESEKARIRMRASEEATALFCVVVQCTFQL